MQCKLVAILFAAILYVVSADKSCAGGFKDGDQVDRGRYWYTCTDAQLVPKGCFSDDRKRLNLHDTFKSGQFLLECTIDNSGYLSFAYKGCVSEAGKELAPGDSWEDDKYWYTCTTEGDHLRMDIGGCVDDSKKRFNIGETAEKGDFIYECRRWANNTCSMCPVACKHDGKRYNVGDSFDQGKFWYMCTKDEGKLQVKCLGCMHDSQKLKDGDRYFLKDSVYECAVRKDVEPRHLLVGCHDTDNGATIERRLGCQWTKGSPPNQYVMKCDSKDNDLTAYKETVRCFYGSSAAGGYEIEPGCYKIIDNTQIVACRMTPDGPTIETFPADQLQQVYSKGVKFCN